MLRNLANQDQALLVSIFEKLIPALPFDFRVAAMRQMNEKGNDSEEQRNSETNVLEYVSQSDAYRNRLRKELEGMPKFDPSA